MSALTCSRYLMIGSTIAATALLTLACTAEAPAPATPAPNPSGLEKKIARFAPVDLTVDIAALSGNEPAALAHIIRAARLMDGLFLEQVWAANPSLLAQLAADGSTEGR